jgi:hypothetical protein
MGLALGVSAAARGGDSDLTFNLRDETAPAGGIVQLKLEETEVSPISGGRPRMSFPPGWPLAGVGMFAPGGELAGAAVIDGDKLSITYVTTAPGSGGDYPILTVSLQVPPNLPEGSEATVTLDPSSIWQIGGATLASRLATATVTVGGSLAVTRVVPGEGWFPAGTIVSVQGTGFVAGTRLRFNGNRRRDAQVVSPTEMQFRLPETMNLSGAELRIDSPDGSRVILYSYLRGIPAETSQRPLLSMTQPVFSGVARSMETLEPIPALGDAQYAALALQNQNLQRADLTLELYAADGSLLRSVARSLESGHRLTLEVSELFGGLAPTRGASVCVESAPPIEAFGLLVDEGTGTVTPRLMVEGPPRPPRQLRRLR